MNHKKQTFCSILALMLRSGSLATGYKMHICGNFFGTIRLFDFTFSYRASIDNLHSFEVKICFPKNGCHGNMKIIFFSFS